MHHHGANWLQVMLKQTTKIALFSLLTALISVNSAAQISTSPPEQQPVTTKIYRSVDQNGVVSFSDVPASNTEQQQTRVITPSVLNTMPGVAVRENTGDELLTGSPVAGVPAAGEPSESDEVTTSSHTSAPSLTIVSPADNATIAMGAGIFDVVAAVTPPLLPDHFLQLYLDGEAIGEPQKASRWTLTYVLRGEHRLQVRRLTDSDETIDESSLTTIFVLRPSILRGMR